MSFVPVSSPVPRTISSISVTIPSKSAVATGWKTIADRPRVVMLWPVSRVMYAVVSANSRSSAAGGLAFVRPRRLSRKPIREFYRAPCSCASSRASCAIRFSTGGCVEKRPRIDFFVLAGMM